MTSRRRSNGSRCCLGRARETCGPGGGHLSARGRLHDPGSERPRRRSGPRTISAAVGRRLVGAPDRRGSRARNTSGLAASGAGAIEELIDLPLMSDADWRATMDVLADLMPPALVHRRESVLPRRRAAWRTSASQHGNSDGSCHCLCLARQLLGPRFGDYRRDFASASWPGPGREARTRSLQARVYLALAPTSCPGRSPCAPAVGFLRRAFDTAQETGDLTYAAYSCVDLITHFLAAGDPLDAVQREVEMALEFVRKARFGVITTPSIGQLRLIRTLRGLTPAFCSSATASSTRASSSSNWTGIRAGLCCCCYWIRKLQACFHAGDYASRASRPQRSAATLSWHGCARIFRGRRLSFLRRACPGGAYAMRRPPRSGDSIWTRSARHHGADRGLGARTALTTFANRAHWWAPRSRAWKGGTLTPCVSTKRPFDRARAGFVQNEGIANELAARFYAARGFNDRRCLSAHARDCYLRWGADGKVRQLDQRSPAAAREAGIHWSTATIGTPVEQLDVATSVKGSQAVSGEIELDKLIETLMMIAIEHAGAERGLLILLARRGAADCGGGTTAAIRSRSRFGKVEVVRGLSRIGASLRHPDAGKRGAGRRLGQEPVFRTTNMSGRSAADPSCACRRSNRRSWSAYSISRTA